MLFCCVQVIHGQAILSCYFFIEGLFSAYHHNIKVRVSSILNKVIYSSCGARRIAVLGGIPTCISHVAQNEV